MNLQANAQAHLNNTDEILKLFHQYKDTQLFVLIIENNIDFLGKVSSQHKQLIQNAIKQNNCHEMDYDIYKIDLTDKIYLFKKFGNLNKSIFFGIITDRTNENRLDLMGKQVKHILKKSESW